MPCPFLQFYVRAHVHFQDMFHAVLLVGACRYRAVVIEISALDVVTNQSVNVMHGLGRIQRPLTHLIGVLTPSVSLFTFVTSTVYSSTW